MQPAIKLGDAVEIYGFASMWFNGEVVAILNPIRGNPLYFVKWAGGCKWYAEREMVKR